MLKKLISIILASALALSLTACKEDVAQESHIVDKEANTIELAEKKAESLGSADTTVVDEDGTTRNVNLGFRIVNNTGVNIVQMFVEPMSTDISQIMQGTKLFSDDFVLKNGENTIIQNPSGMITTTLFNILACDETGRGFLFQNIDLSTNSIIELTFENGVPKANMK